MDDTIRIRFYYSSNTLLVGRSRLFTPPNREFPWPPARGWLWPVGTTFSASGGGEEPAPAAATAETGCPCKPSLAKMAITALANRSWTETAQLKPSSCPALPTIWRRGVDDPYRERFGPVESADAVAPVVSRLSLRPHLKAAGRRPDAPSELDQCQIRSCS